ncbi:MAG: hypothetical protein IV100_12895 [Myxococcales bacterium]|nr:hypothetical protein [Myxococcales bacterium]
MIGRPTDSELGVVIVVVLAIVGAIQVFAGLWDLVVDAELGGVLPLAFGIGVCFCAWDWHRFQLDPPGTPVPAGTAFVVAVIGIYLLCVGGFCALSSMVPSENNHLVHPAWVWLGFPTIGVAVLMIMTMVRTVNAKRAPPGTR